MREPLPYKMAMKGVDIRGDEGTWEIDELTAGEQKVISINPGVRR